MDKTAIFIPSLNRPHKIEPLLQNIKEVTPEPHEVYFMVSDKESVNILKRKGVNFWQDKKDTRYVTRMNFMYRNTTEPYMFMGSDDIWFYPDWLTNALRKMHEGYSVVVGDDMLNSNGTMALISRRYVDEQSCCIDTPRVLFYPDYHHDFADTEQFETAQKRGVFARAMDSIVEHQHWANDKSPKDATYELSSKYSVEDYGLFQSRKHLWA